MRARHAPFRIGIAERDRWLELMTAAMDEAALPEPAGDFLKALFAQIADFMRNQAAPAAGGFRLNPLPGKPQGS